MAKVRQQIMIEQEEREFLVKMAARDNISLGEAVRRCVNRYRSNGFGGCKVDVSKKEENISVTEEELEVISRPVEWESKLQRELSSVENQETREYLDGYAREHSIGSWDLKLVLRRGAQEQ